MPVTAGFLQLKMVTADGGAHNLKAFVKTEQGDLGEECKAFLLGMGFPGCTVGQDRPAVQEPQQTRVRFLGWEESPGEGHGNPLQHSCLENPHGQRSLAGYSLWGLGFRHD